MDTTEKIINDLKYHIIQGSERIPMNFSVIPTKGSSGKINGFLYRDKNFEEQAIKWFAKKVDIFSIFKKYEVYNGSDEKVVWPSHYAARLNRINGVLQNGDNVFLIFPLAFGEIAESKNDYFGFEFIDVWQSIFDNIVFPCIQRTFTADSFQQLLDLKPLIPQLAYLTAIFHEIGHTVGTWKAVPQLNSQIKLPKFFSDVLSELATDAMILVFLKEVPEIQLFLLLARIFWFGRIGFDENNTNYGINSDNDAWIGNYLWNKCIQYHCFLREGSRWKIQTENINICFQSIFKDTNWLGHAMVANQNQHELVTKWMENSVLLQDDIFKMNPELIQVFLKCINIPTKAIVSH